MLERYPIYTFIEERCESIGIGRSEVARRCNFENVSKGLQRFNALCGGDVGSPGMRMILDTLPAALEVDASELERVVMETANIIART
ncbi:MAG: hypothetical protein ACR652_11750 [Methylocystis sp.]|uniref:hypothetical protein n=1 Tax=Methylocystis sp. TaxID=1911079 RepID=UPI003DA43010